MYTRSPQRGAGWGSSEAVACAQRRTPFFVFFIHIFFLFLRNSRLCAHRAALLWVICFLRDGLDNFPAGEDPFYLGRKVLNPNRAKHVCLPGIEPLTFAQVKQCWTTSLAENPRLAFKNAKIAKEKKSKNMRGGGRKRKAPQAEPAAEAVRAPAGHEVAVNAGGRANPARTDTDRFCLCRTTEEENDPADLFVECSGEDCAYNGWVHLLCVGDDVEYAAAVRDPMIDYLCPECRKV